MARLLADAFLGGFERFEELFGRGIYQGGKLRKGAVLGGDAVDPAVLFAAVGEKERAVRGGGEGARAEGGVFGGEQLGRGSVAGKGVPDTRGLGEGGGEEGPVEFGREVAAADDDGAGTGGGSLLPKTGPVGLFREWLRASVHHRAKVPELRFGIGKEHVAPGGEERAGRLVEAAAQERLELAACRLKAQDHPARIRQKAGARLHSGTVGTGVGPVDRAPWIT